MDKVALKCDNPLYPPLTVSLEEFTSRELVLARAVWVGQEL